MKKRALLSVSNKQGIVEFARGLSQLGFELISTGGTAAALLEAGIGVLKVAEITGFPEILEGRVKTLHPKIHAGILAKAEDAHLKQLAELDIQMIDLVAVNLYPFREAIAKEGATLDDALENIDIGGPSMVRAAAKNYRRVAVVVKPERYEEVLGQLRERGEVDEKTRQLLALEAFSHTAGYDMAISGYLSRIVSPGDFPLNFFLGGEKAQELRYGENPHQKAAFYRLEDNLEGTLAGARQLQGKELSYNNLVDLQAAWSVVSEHKEPAATVIKHTNPCGTALGENIRQAYIQAHGADALSAFGGIIGLNRSVDEETAQEIVKTFMEAVIAPSFSREALQLLSSKTNLRILEMGNILPGGGGYWIEPVSGGFLVQDLDGASLDLNDLNVVSHKKPDKNTLLELLFAWKVVKHVKSNAIVITKDKVTLGIGAGQMNRVGAAKIALEQAGERARGAVLASDAFFPFADSVELAAKNGIKAVIQPGGSIRDEDTIAKANEYGIVMVLTGIRHFRH